ncbi:MAG: right-handed parallel beta-helix repeat-containing protein, partial [Pirellula sp.]
GNYYRLGNLEVIGNRVYANLGAGVSVAGPSSLVASNTIYSNAVGIATNAAFYGSNAELTNNVVYANRDFAFVLQGANVRAFSNTIRQSAGAALKATNANVFLRNNILQVDLGSVLELANTPFIGNFNLYSQNGSMAILAKRDGLELQNLAQWQSASSQDANSRSGDPRWVDPDGADNLLGWSFTGGGVDGGVDDNFELLPTSIAIDAGSVYFSSDRDLVGRSSNDDPGSPNSGEGLMAEVVASSSQYAEVGVGMGWKAGFAAWTLPLPFAFPLAGRIFNQVYVSSSGFLHFDGPDWLGSTQNSDEVLARNVRVAPLWSALWTQGVNDDIYVERNVPGQVTIRWDASRYGTNDEVQFSATLFADGRVRFDYGQVNGVVSPTIGIGLGSELLSVFSIYDGSNSLTNVPSVEFASTPGYRDMGALEFSGNSLDTQAPRLLGSNPNGIHLGTWITDTSQIALQFSESINPFDARSESLYELRFAGVNGQFDDSDDEVRSLRPQYATGSTNLTLRVSDLVGGLKPGLYRFKIISNNNATIHDLAGLALDGDGDGVPGGDYLRFFEVLGTNPPTDLYFDQVQVDENTATNTADLYFGKLRSVDADLGDSFQYALVVGQGDTDNDRFVIADDSIYLKQGELLDFESKPTYEVRIRSTDRYGLFLEKSFTIFVTNVNEDPTDISLTNMTIPENAGPNATVGYLNTTDPDQNDTFTYSFVLGAGDTDNAAFVLDGNILKAVASFNFEEKSSYSVRVRSTDQDGLYTEKEFVISIEDLPEGLVINGTSGNDTFIATYTGNGIGHSWNISRNGVLAFSGSV